ncbi:MAG: M28 family metallopeptidase [Isosphaerales bacterium]
MGPLRSLPRGFSTIILLSTLGSGPVRGSGPLAASDPIPSNTTVSSCPLGFTPRSSPGQLQAESHALSVPTPENARKLLRVLTAEPHVAGTPADYKTAVFVRDKLREWGWKADLAELEVLLNYPVGGRFPQLEIQRPIAKSLSLDEAPIATDKDSASSDAFGAFHGYGVSGEAKGQVVYVNFGRPEDFTALEKMGIDVKGKIVLARYGGIFRGLKVRNAQKRGAAGILIYSDPADDGFAKGDIYPNGRFRPGSAIQRGSVQFLSLGPGDPSTPFGPSVKGAKRLPFDRSNGFTLHQSHFRPAPFPDLDANIPVVDEWEKTTGLKRADYFATIPSLPLSYDAAHEIFKLLAGPNTPADWQGGLPLPYHVGPGPAEVFFWVEMDYQLRTIWNVIATIPGTVEPDRWVMLGNHRDAWVYGAVDPGSGTAATLETCRALGAAVKNGWKPRRTILYASWDAEEYGLVGSTEWAEEHAKSIDEQAVLMLNVDSAVSGPTLEMSGVPSLRELVLDAAGSIVDPRSGKTLRAAWTDERRAAWASSAPLVLTDPIWDSPVTVGKDGLKAKTETPSEFVPQMGWLGSGSDYTAYVDHLAVPVVDAGFKGGYGVYHSIYDNFNWMEKFGDPEFLTHATAARLYTLIMMRAAAADVVPLKFAPYGRALREHVDQLRTIHAHRVRKNDPSTSKGETEFPGLSRLVEAVRAFQAQAGELDRATGAVAARDDVGRDDLKKLNDALAKVERAFLLERGLPDRAWFKHSIYAPGLTTGYACWPLPAIRQALEDDNTTRLAAGVTLTVERIEQATAALSSARDRAQAALMAH